MSVLSWIIVGLMAGWLAGMVMKGGGYGVLGDIFVGMIGALVGGFLATTLFGAPSPGDGINLTSIFVAFIGAIITIGIVRAFTPATRV
jgi:uncharacterized membrane protein YeaQ/YmgE (transglycosylase-associated protein family)